MAKKARITKVKARGPDGPMETAETVTVGQIMEEKEDKKQTARIAVLKKVLKAHGETAGDNKPKRVNLFHLLVHPTSFSQARKPRSSRGHQVAIRQ